MSDTWLDKWNERYAAEEYAYGELPNEFLKDQLSKLPPGRILFPAEGEGRNAVFAAKLGWIVSAFDISAEGKKKAMRLAERNGVTIDYKVGDLEDLEFTPEGFDALALIYAHFPAEVKSRIHKSLDKYVRKGGTVIFEAFSKNHVHYQAKNPKVGGPRDVASLFSVEEILEDFSDYQALELREKEAVLEEGLYHEGEGSVIRFVGVKK